MPDSPLDPTTRATLLFLSNQLKVNYFILRAVKQGQLQLTEQERVTRARLAELHKRFDRELDAHPELRGSQSGDGDESAE